MKMLGITFFIYAIIYIISIWKIRKLMKSVEKDYSKKKNKLEKENQELKNQLREQRYLLENDGYYPSEQEQNYQNKLQEIRNKIKEFRSKQIYRNVNLIYNEIEEILNKKELPSLPNNR